MPTAILAGKRAGACRARCGSAPSTRTAEPFVGCVSILLKDFQRRCRRRRHHRRKAHPRSTADGTLDHCSLRQHHPATREAIRIHEERRSCLMRQLLSRPRSLIAPCPAIGFLGYRCANCRRRRSHGAGAVEIATAEHRGPHDDSAIGPVRNGLLVAADDVNLDSGQRVQPTPPGMCRRIDSTKPASVSRTGRGGLRPNPPGTASEVAPSAKVRRSARIRLGEGKTICATTPPHARACPYIVGTANADARLMFGIAAPTTWSVQRRKDHTSPLAMRSRDEWPRVRGRRSGNAGRGARPPPGQHQAGNCRTMLAEGERHHLGSPVVPRREGQVGDCRSARARPSPAAAASVTAVSVPRPVGSSPSVAVHPIVSSLCWNAASTTSPADEPCRSGRSSSADWRSWLVLVVTVAGVAQQVGDDELERVCSHRQRGPTSTSPWTGEDRRHSSRAVVEQRVGDRVRHRRGSASSRCRWLGTWAASSRACREFVPQSNRVDRRAEMLRGPVRAVSKPPVTLETVFHDCC